MWSWSLEAQAASALESPASLRELGMRSVFTDLKRMAQTPLLLLRHNLRSRFVIRTTTFRPRAELQTLCATLRESLVLLIFLLIMPASNTCLLLPNLIRTDGTR